MRALRGRALTPVFLFPLSSSPRPP